MLALLVRWKPGFYALLGKYPSSCAHRELSWTVRGRWKVWPKGGAGAGTWLGWASLRPCRSGNFSCTIVLRKSSLCGCVLVCSLMCGFCLPSYKGYVSYLWPITVGLESTTLSPFRRANVAPFYQQYLHNVNTPGKLNDNGMEQRVPVTSLSGKSFGIFPNRWEDSRGKILMWGIP